MWVRACTTSYILGESGKDPAEEENKILGQKVQLNRQKCWILDQTLCFFGSDFLQSMSFFLSKHICGILFKYLEVFFFSFFFPEAYFCFYEQLTWLVTVSISFSLFSFFAQVSVLYSICCPGVLAWWPHLDTPLLMCLSPDMWASVCVRACILGGQRGWVTAFSCQLPVSTTNKQKKPLLLLSVQTHRHNQYNEVSAQCIYTEQLRGCFMTRANDRCLSSVHVEATRTKGRFNHPKSKLLDKLRLWGC